ncbi:LPS sulfotransferase NodH [Nonomuraea solani]|uniref:Trehalose 2-sulfotransferase n=1 Tax=Nonomuraea solani TaxID=1144553 RepID=A0A1H6EPS9_9ACTN|nr:Stf0 family sulfotransferase [Nonomuraea solani]SEG99880.1 LPS sulfotransferase NodH [Nonomuraea solani]
MAPFFRTNSTEFDFPPFAGLPPVRYVLAAAPRSGSNMLVRTLWHTGRAGFADGYLTDTHVLDYFERWGFETADPAGLVKDYIRRLMTCRTSPNGVFGLKVHGEHLPGLEVDLDELLLSPRYIWLRRRDRVRQAISYVLAKQTGVWIVDGVYLSTSRARTEPRYDYAEILRHLHQLDAETRVWERYFARRGHEPHVVYYEDMLADHPGTVLGCLRHLGVQPPDSLPDPGIKRQSGEVTERWVARFERDVMESSR